MQNWKFAAFGFAIGAMMVFFPLSGKLKEAKEQETKLSILMDVTCLLPRKELENKLATVVAPDDIGQFEQGQNKALWDKTKAALLTECFGNQEPDK